MKHRKLLIICAIFIIILVIVNYFFSYNFIINKIENSTIVNTSIKLVNEIYANGKIQTIVTSAIKGNDIYIKQTNFDLTNVVESYYSEKDKKLYTIMHSEKTIIENNKEEYPLNINFLNIFKEHKKNNKIEYKSMGLKYINNQLCLKFSLLNASELKAQEYVYYFNLKNNNIIKIEEYNIEKNENIKLSNIYYLEYDIQEIEKIINFDKTNYPNYNYIEQ